MIEVDRRRLDAQARERWERLLAHPPILARPSPSIEAELIAFLLIIWGALFVATFDPLTHAPPWGVVVARAVTAIAVLGLARASLWMWRARRAQWTNGRVLHDWGYAEIEHDVLRAVPMRDVSLELRGRRWGLGSVRLLVAVDGRVHTFHLAAEELERVARWLDEGGARHAALEIASYRGGARRLEGARPARRMTTVRRELALVVAGTLVAVALPQAPEADAYTPAAPTAPAMLPVMLPVTSSYLPPGASALDLTGCSPSEVVVASVASYLTLALSTPRLGPARTAVLGSAARVSSPARPWARCSWQVDRRTGLLDRAEARWGWTRPDGRRVQRHALAPTEAVTAVIEGCRAVDGRLDYSPRGLAYASLRLLEETITSDVSPSRGRSVPGSPAAAQLSICIARVRRVYIAEL